MGLLEDLHHFIELLSVRIRYISGKPPEQLTKLPVCLVPTPFVDGGLIVPYMSEAALRAEPRSRSGGNAPPYMPLSPSDSAPACSKSWRY